MDKKLYIGDKEIRTIKDETVHFQDGTEKKYTLLGLTYLISEEPRDETQMQEISTSRVAEDLISVIEKHDLPMFDINLSFQKAHNALKDAQENAFADALGLPKGGTGMQRMMDARLSELNAVRK